jgi:hypothetical protein
MGGACSANEENRYAYRLLVLQPDGKRLVRKPSRKWMDNIKMDLGEIGSMVWTRLVWFKIGTIRELL